MKKITSILLALIISFVLIIPQPAEAAVKISKAKATLEVDATLKLKISGTKSTPTWSSNKKSVATVDKKGTVTAKAEGQATITAKVDGKNYSCVVTVVDSNKPVENKQYKLGETWVVDGLWKLTFNSVTSTDYRNPFHDSNPSQVVILDYTYENLGYEGDIQDLYISSLDFSVIDEHGNVASTYPANTTKYPQVVPIGARCVGAQQGYGLEEESTKITVYVELYGNNYDKHKATFVLDVQ